MLDETQDLALIRSILVETFPEASRRVGKTNLNDIVKRRGQIQVVHMSGASRIEWTDALSLLATSAVLVSQWLTDRGRAEWSLHFNQTNHVSQEVQIGQVDQGSQVHVSNEFQFSIPPEIAGNLEPAALDRLIASFVAHLAAERGRE